MKTKTNNSDLKIPSALLAVLLLSGCATPDSGVFKEEPFEPPTSTTAAAFVPGKYRTVAVLSTHEEPGSLFERAIYRDKDAPIHSLMEDYFTQTLLGKGYKVASRSDVSSLLREIDFQNSGLTEANAAKLGRMLNVSSVLLIRTVSLNQTKSAYTEGKEKLSVTVGARLIDVSSAEILWIGNNRLSKVILLPASYRNQDAVPGFMENLFLEAGQKLASTFPDCK